MPVDPIGADVRIEARACRRRIRKQAYRYSKAILRSIGPCYALSGEKVMRSSMLMTAVRGRLKSVFQKTGTRRQAELVIVVIRAMNQMR
jgi:hypothetical protein